MKNWLLFTLCMAVVFRFAAHSAELVRKGCPVSEILIDPSAHPAVRHAAEELSFFCGKISGGRLAVGSVPDRRIPGKIILVTPDAAIWKTLSSRYPEFVSDRKRFSGNDGYAVRTRGNTTYLLAGNPKGILNGVYRWLQKNTDIIWPRPADGLAMYSPKKDLIFQQCDYIDIPGFSLRYFGSGAGDPEVTAYLTRNAMNPHVNLQSLSKAKTGVRENLEKWGAVNTYFDFFGGGHSLVSQWFPQSEFYAEHPEYYMLVDGKRYRGKGGNLCETNPEMVRAYCRSVEEKIKDLPATCREIRLMIQDTNQTCTCDKCLAPIRLPDGTMLDKSHEAFRSTRFFMFFNQVARHVKKLRPDLIVQQYAYIHLAVPPKIPVENNIQLEWCPYPRNMKESIAEGASNRKWKARLDGWLAVTPNIYFREYYFCGCIYYPRPMADTAAVDLRYIAAHGVKSVYCDRAANSDSTKKFSSAYKLDQPHSEYWDFCGVEAWTIQQLFWDPDQDPVMLRREFLKRTFRESAAEMTAFYELLRKSWYSDTMASAWNDNAYQSAARYIVSKKIDRQCRELLEKAEKKAENPAVLQWVRSIRQIVERYIAQAPNHMNLGMTVPLVRCGSFPGFDLDQGVWKQAASFPVLKRIGAKNVRNPHPAALRIFSDGRSFHIGMFAGKAPGTLYAEKPAGRESFPVGDGLELFFSSMNRGYFHFAFDKDMHRYDACVLDGGWNGDWEVRTQTAADGWRAVVRIPFRSIGFDPVVNNKISFLPMITYYFGGRGKNFLASWNGGIPHSPVSWSELSVDIE